YDAHIILKSIAKTCLNKYKNRKIMINCIPDNSESYKSFELKVLVQKIIMIIDNKKIEKYKYLIYRFLDSYAFLQASLENVVAANNKFKHFDNYFNKKYPNIDNNILKRKGVYPYSYFNSFDKFNERKLPKKMYFYNDLEKEHISSDDYKFCKKVFKLYKCKTLKDYHDLYLLTDCLLLADCFENFRRVMLKQYNLEPLWYYGLSNMTYDNFLKYTKSEIKCFKQNEINLALEIQKNLRGGISMISRRYSKANNKYMNELYNPNEESSYIIMMDMNNLYGRAMIDYLPIGNFYYVKEEKIKEYNKNIDKYINKLLKIKENNKYGYFICCDIEIKPELHDYLNDYSIVVNKDIGEYSPLMEYIIESNKIYHKTKFNFKPTKMLIPTLKNQKNYLCHYRMLQFMINHGIILKKLHYIVRFDQKDFIRPYIEMNTQLRQKSKTKFEKNIFKLLNNSLYGKFIQNVFKYVNLKLLLNEKDDKHFKLVNSPLFKRNIIFDSNFEAIEMKKERVLMNMPIHIGFSILELSKLYMFQFYYDILKPH